MVSTLKFPSAMEKPAFSALARPNPKVSTDKVRVRRRAITNSRAQRVNLKKTTTVN